MARLTATEYTGMGGDSNNRENFELDRVILVD